MYVIKDRNTDLYYSERFNKLAFMGEHTKFFSTPEAAQRKLKGYNHYLGQISLAMELALQHTWHDDINKRQLRERIKEYDLCVERVQIILPETAVD